MNQADQLFYKIRPYILVTDISFMSYWAISALVAAGLLNIPTEYLYNDYHNQYVFDWNWSFFPLDLLFALTGFLAVWLHGKNNPNWLVMALVSSVLTFCSAYGLLDAAIKSRTTARNFGKKNSGQITKARLGIHQLGSNSKRMAQYEIAIKPAQNVSTLETSAITSQFGLFLPCNQTAKNPVRANNKSSGKNDQFQSKTY